MINPNLLKGLAIVSNIFVVVGFILLIMMKLVLAITMFAVAITISLMMFNVLFRDKNRNENSCKYIICDCNQSHYTSILLAKINKLERYKA